jgi:hypothetical protein
MRLPQKIIRAIEQNSNTYMNAWRRKGDLWWRPKAMTLWSCEEEKRDWKDRFER